MTTEILLQSFPVCKIKFKKYLNNKIINYLKIYKDKIGIFYKM